MLLSRTFKPILPFSITKYTPFNQFQRSGLRAYSKMAETFTTSATIASFGGKLLKLEHKSSSTGTPMKLNLYLPAASEKGKVPVIYYLAGLTCTGDNGAEKGFFQAAASKHGIAIVYPDTSPRSSLSPSLPHSAVRF